MELTLDLIRELRSMGATSIEGGGFKVTFPVVVRMPAAGQEIASVDDQPPALLRRHTDPEQALIASLKEYEP